jgi:uncharacterized protein
MKMNRLAGASSPYLLQHADNPVDWWPWTSEAFEEAKRRNVPVHLSIGYAACHWCHVMARESFSDPATAELLNRDFVNIKVDREERPEVDQIYMGALHALGERGGWPLTMFLTPAGEPFWGGTYFPPEPLYGRPSFRQVLQAVSAAWKSGHAAIAQNSAALRELLNRPAAQTESVPSRDILDRAAQKILSIWDMQSGSFRGAPKFPNPTVLELLWRNFLRTGNLKYQSAVVTTLRFLCQGGIYDHLGGGFARYSTDAEWKVPHFEKMLYDNGLLLSALAFAYRATGNPLFRARIDETVGWLAHEMRVAGGGLASSLDADTDHEEGLTYVWSWSELKAALGPDLQEFASVYDASPSGNWEGKIILNRINPAAREWLGDAREAELQAAREKLLRIRDARPKPGRDDKVLADWNGLAVSGLAQSARATGNQQARGLAEEAFGFVSTMANGGRLAHSTRAGAMVFPGVATDYANMIHAALEMFSLTGELWYLEKAETWFQAADSYHFDREARAYNLAASDAPPLIARPLSLQDEATPAATGVMAENAAILFMLTADSTYRSRSEEVLTQLAARGEQDVVGSASLQNAYDTHLRGRVGFIVGTTSSAAGLLEAAMEEADPALIVVNPDPSLIRPEHPAAGKLPRGEAALFICDALRCLPEAADPSAANRILAETRFGLA